MSEGEFHQLPESHPTHDICVGGEGGYRFRSTHATAPRAGQLANASQLRLGALLCYLLCVT